MDDDLLKLLDIYPRREKRYLIPALQTVQDKLGYISKDSVTTISKYLDIPPSAVYSVASFYNQFWFQPRGKNHIRVCNGTSCHIRKNAMLIDFLEKNYNLSPSSVTKDTKFSLELVPCLGGCAHGPVISINNEYFAEVNVDFLKKKLTEID